MPPADGLTKAARRPGRVAETGGLLGGWGGLPSAPMRVLRPHDPESLRGAVAQVGLAGGRPGAIPRGLGRSYGDAAQLGRGYAIDTTALKSIEIDSAAGAVTVLAGVSVGELLAATVPAGWMVPVVPGTQHVTVGGAIASDIHGKNHEVAGSFGASVQALGLVAAAGELLELTPADELFRATLGGMGLTGVIAWARISLRRVTSAWMSVDTERLPDLDAVLAALVAPGGSYRVAWLDLLGRRPGRGVVTRAEHLDGAPARQGGAVTVRGRLTVPRRCPSGLLRPSVVRAFNELRYRRVPRSSQGDVHPLGAHLFPLDVLDRWPRLYGRGGLLQYQFVVPYGTESTLRAVLDTLRRARVPCYLAVLKGFGAAGPAPLSFPMAGWTLAMDMPAAVDGVRSALDRCDELVAGAGGRVYLTKDARLRPDVVRAMYPRLAEWQAVRDAADPEGLWRSDLAARTGLLDAEA